MSEWIVRDLAAADAEPLAAAFAAIGWNKPVGLFRRYCDEAAAGRRRALVAVSTATGEVAGYVTVVWEPDYPPFRDARIPEIVDLNVLPHLQRRGIGSALLDAAETAIGERSPVAGIGVGLSADYGAAQRLYVVRGYVPDGRGIAYDDVPVAKGSTTRVDDALVLHFTKELRPR